MRSNQAKNLNQAKKTSIETISNVIKRNTQKILYARVCSSNAQ